MAYLYLQCLLLAFLIFGEPAVGSDLKQPGCQVPKSDIVIPANEVKTIYFKGERFHSLTINSGNVVECYVQCIANDEFAIVPNFGIITPDKCRANALEVQLKLRNDAFEEQATLLNAALEEQTRLNAALEEAKRREEHLKKLLKKSEKEKKRLKDALEKVERHADKEEEEDEDDDDSSLLAGIVLNAALGESKLREER
eukprot:775837_1